MSTSPYKKELDELRESIPKVLNECIREYGLELCGDGLEDFCSRLGATYVPMNDFQVTITVKGIPLEASEQTEWPHRTIPADWDDAELELVRVIDKFFTDRYGPDVVWDETKIDVEEV